MSLETLHPFWVSQAVTLLTALALVCAFALLAVRTTNLCVRVYAAQSLLLGLAGVLLSLRGHATALGVGILAIVMKGFLIPWFLFRVMEDMDIRREAEPFVPPALSLFMGVGLALLAYGAFKPLTADGSAAGRGFAMSLTLMLLGLWLMAARRKAITQVVGILVVENGLFVAAISTSFHLPLIVELGLAFDLLVAVVVIGLLVFRIRDTFVTIDTERLNRLKG